MIDGNNSGLDLDRPEPPTTDTASDTSVSVAPSRLRPADIARVGTIGLRSRPLRTTLTALGIAIGIAAMVAVVGISTSSRADLLAQIDALGTDLLRAAPGQSLTTGNTTTLPETARSTAGRIGPVTQSAGLTNTTATIRRNPYIDAGRTGGITVAAGDTQLLDTTSAALASGRFHDAASSALPTVVLGADAADHLGIRDLDHRPSVWISRDSDDGQWFVVIGILRRAPLAPALDYTAIIGYDVAKTLYDTPRSPGTLFIRTTPDQVEAVRAVLARSIKPDAPQEVDVSRPSDALEARARTDTALRNLLLGLGAVALIVGGIGITNVMVISVLERRAEIGVRRALGAKRRHIATQFLAESACLSLLGGVAGCALGYAATAIYANTQRWPAELPTNTLTIGIATAVAIGLLAGVSPAIRAARLDPAEAIRPT